MKKGSKHSEEAKQKMSESLRHGYATGSITPTKYWFGKKRPLSDDTKKKIGDANRGRKLTSEHIEKLRDSHHGQTPWNKGKEQSEETKIKVSESVKRAYMEGRLPVCRYWKGKHMTEGSNRKRSESLKCAYADGRIHARVLSSTEARIMRLNQIIPTKDTLPERLLQEELTKYGIAFEAHKSILGITQPDILINDKVAIYVDGCWWHGCSQCIDQNKFDGRHRLQIMKDQLITQKLVNGGYKVLRFWEHEIKRNPEFVLFKIKEVIAQCVRV